MFRSSVSTANILGQKFIALLSAVLLLGLAQGAHADFWDPTFGAQGEPRRYVQAVLGSGQIDALRPPGETQETDLIDSESVYIFGLVVQHANKTGYLQYGVEGGGQLGFGSNRSLFVRLAGTGSSIRVQTDVWTGDLSFGGFLSARLGPYIRLYGAAGPAFYWGRASGWNTENNNQDNNNSEGMSKAAIAIDLGDDRDDLGITWYARAGVEFTLSPRVNLGLSVRKLDAQLEFGDHGRMRIDEPTYLLTLGYTY